MEMLSGAGLVWLVVIVVFVWMVAHYGLGVGKERDVAEEFSEMKDETDIEAAKHADVRAKDLTSDEGQDHNQKDESKKAS